MQVLQPQPSRNSAGLGSSRLARHYYGNHYCFLFLRVLRCFSSPGLPSESSSESPDFIRRGCPIRISTDHSLLATPRGFSQLITSFFASESLGIPHTPFFTSFNARVKRDMITLVCSLLAYFLTTCQRTLFLPALKLCPRACKTCRTYTFVDTAYQWRITDSNR